tara:strand:+ start:648 stop:1259 length:612 start_codon:yes stop_codon:yes gene_type:complete
MILNILTSFIFYFFTTYILNKTEYKSVADSVIILINSSIIVISTTLFLNQMLTSYALSNTLSFSIGFYINDLIYNKKQVIVKSIHHFISLMGILTFPYYQIEIAYLFQTELSNLPLEIRNILYKRKIKYPIINTLLIILFYILFFQMRIYNGYDLMKSICSKDNPNDCFLTIGIYILWWYWFILITWKVFKKIVDFYIDFLVH